MLLILSIVSISNLNWVNKAAIEEFQSLRMYSDIFSVDAICQ